MRKILLLFFIIFTSSIYSQNKNDNHLIKSYTYKISLPFELVQNLIVINDITIDHRKGSFIFDTGNKSALILNSAAFQYEITEQLFSQNPFTNDTSKGITGNIPVSYSLKIDSLTLAPDFIFGGLNAVAFDLEHIRKKLGKNILGFIGYGVFREVECAIDYEKKLIHMYRLDENGNTLDEPFYKRKFLLNFTLDNGGIVSNLYFAGKMLDFFFDTGAPKNSINAAVISQLDKSFISLTGLKDTIQEDNGGKIITADALMSSLTIQDEIFTSMDTNIYPYAPNTNYNITLGYPFFKQRLFVINYKKRQIYIAGKK